MNNFSELNYRIDKLNERIKNFGSDFIEMLSGRIDKIAEDRKAKDSMYDPNWTLIDSNDVFSNEEYNKYKMDIELYRDIIDMDKHMKSKVTTPYEYDYGTMDFKGGVSIKYRQHNDKIEIEASALPTFIKIIKGEIK